jgi:hypothetical protein
MGTIQQVARMSEATCGVMRRPGYRFAHPGYARYELLSIRLFTLSKSIRNVLLTLISDVPANVAKAAN